MKKIIAIISSCLFVIGCGYKDVGVNCYHGKIIMSSCCTGSTFISIVTPIQIGKNTRLNGLDHSNVIQVPDYLTGIDVYLNLRKYDPQKDASLFPIHCYCLIAEGMDVPIFVATAVSTNSCSDHVSLH